MVVNNGKKYPDLQELKFMICSIISFLYDYYITLSDLFKYLYSYFKFIFKNYI